MGRQAWAQKKMATETPLHFSNPSVPGTLVVEQKKGFLRVEGYAGKEIKIEAQHPDSLQPAPAYFQVQERNNTVHIQSESPAIFQIQVPQNTSLQLTMSDSGRVEVAKTHRLVEINNARGAVVLKDLEGWALVNTVDGDILASFREVVANKPMAFATLNGRIDLEMPSSLQAQLRIKTENPDFLNEFVETEPALAEDKLRIQSKEQAKESLPAATQPGKIAKKKSAARSLSSPADALAEEYSDSLVRMEEVAKPSSGDSPPQSKEALLKSYRLSETYSSEINGGGPVILLSTRKGQIAVRKRRFK
ncbi:MAG: hypothetical protein OHK0053_15640 [Microscillaceae bacterium]